jgi:hypothetical protein
MSVPPVVEELRKRAEELRTRVRSRVTEVRSRLGLGGGTSPLAGSILGSGGILQGFGEGLKIEERFPIIKDIRTRGIAGVVRERAGLKGSELKTEQVTTAAKPTVPAEKRIEVADKIERVPTPPETKIRINV